MTHHTPENRSAEVEQDVNDVIDLADMQDPFGGTGYQEGLDRAASDVAAMVSELRSMGVPPEIILGAVCNPYGHDAMMASLGGIRRTAWHFLTGGAE